MSIDEAAGEQGSEGSVAAVDVDAASLAAARAAMGVEPAAEPAAPAAGEVEAPAAAPSAPAAGEPTEIEKLRAEIKAREGEQRQREKLEASYAEKLKAQVDAVSAKIREEVRAEERAAVRSRLKENPFAAISELEVDGAALVGKLAERAKVGPVFDEIAQLRAELAAMKDGGASKDIRAELESLKKAQAEREAAAQREAAAAEERGVVSIVTKEAPAAIAFYGDEANVVKRARAIATEWCTLKGVETCPYDVIVQQLDTEAKKGAAEELKKLDARREALSKLVQQPAPGLAGRPTESNGQARPRTLSAQGASERRASPKPVSEMTPAEQDEAMRAAAREAMGPVKKSRMA